MPIKISELSELLSGLAAGDYLAIVDVDAGTTKRIDVSLLGELFALLTGATFTGTVNAPTLQEGGTNLSATYAALASLNEFTVSQEISDNGASAFRYLRVIVNDGSQDNDVGLDVLTSGVGRIVYRRAGSPTAILAFQTDGRITTAARVEVGNLEVDDGGQIGSNTTPAALTVAANGEVTAAEDLHLAANKDLAFDDYQGHVKFRTADGNSTAARLRMSTGGGNALDIVCLFGDVKITAGSTSLITLWSTVELQDKQLKHTVPSALGTSGSVGLDFSKSNMQKLGTLTGNVTFTTSNLSAGRTMEVLVPNGATLRTLTFPAGWTFVGTKPADIAANKTGVLALSAWGGADSDVVAAWAVQE